jgi:hypothetical protein
MPWRAAWETPQVTALQTLNPAKLKNDQCSDEGQLDLGSHLTAEGSFMALFFIFLRVVTDSIRKMWLHLGHVLDRSSALEFARSLL